jgi:hypothetical protein
MNSLNGRCSRTDSGGCLRDLGTAPLTMSVARNVGIVLLNPFDGLADRGTRGLEDSVRLSQTRTIDLTSSNLQNDF